MRRTYRLDILIWICTKAFISHRCWNPSHPFGTNCTTTIRRNDQQRQPSAMYHHLFGTAKKNIHRILCLVLLVVSYQLLFVCDTTLCITSISWTTGTLTQCSWIRMLKLHALKISLEHISSANRRTRHQIQRDFLYHRIEHLPQDTGFRRCKPKTTL